MNLRTPVKDEFHFTQVLTSWCYHNTVFCFRILQYVHFFGPILGFIYPTAVFFGPFFSKNKPIHSISKKSRTVTFQVVLRYNLIFQFNSFHSKPLKLISDTYGNWFHVSKDKYDSK